MDTQPSTHYHPPEVSAFNNHERLLAASGSKGVDLSAQALMAQARAETELERFGDESFIPALHTMLQTAQEDMQFNPFGRMTLKGRVLRPLKNRLWANACFEAHPEILDRKIVAPIVIVGPGRSGTTRLQRLLAADSRLQHLKTWEGFNPAPRLNRPDHGKAERRAEAESLLQKAREINPGAYAAHPMGTDWAEEEILLINHSFCGVMALGLHRYHNWLLGHDKTSAYRYMADLMRLVSWSRGDPQDKRWVMKTPHHMLDLDVLLRVFPDAKVIFTHRDPLKTVPSTMSLMWHFAVQTTDQPLRAPIRDVWMHLCEQMDRRCMKVRETMRLEQQLDIQYGEVNSDWHAVMQRIYQFVGMTFTPEAQQSVGDWLAASEAENQHGGHTYSLEDFGITAADIHARMAFARERYDIPFEGR